MLTTRFQTQEVNTAYNAIVTGQNNLYHTSTKNALEPLDQLISFLKERHYELERELATYSKHSAWSYDIPHEEKLALPLTNFGLRPVYTAKILLNQETQTEGRRTTITCHLSTLSGIIKTLSQANMELAERVRQKKVEVRTQPSRLRLWEREEEMRILPKKTSFTPEVPRMPHYQLPLDRSPRIPIPHATPVAPPPKGILLETSLTTNSSFTYSSPSSPPASARTATEILELAISFDKKGESTR